MHVRKVRAEMEPPGWAQLLAHHEGGLLVGASLVASATLLLLTYGPLWTKHPPGHLLGPVSWSFTDSWATTLTTVGAVLGTILASSRALPETTTLLTRAGFAGLSLFFGFLVLLSPLLYRAFAHFTNAPQYQGFVGVFVVACATTAWGVMGQLATALLLVQEMVTASTLPASLSIPYPVFLLAALVLVATYTCRWARAIIQTAVPRPAMGVAPALLPEWPLM